MWMECGNDECVLESMKSATWFSEKSEFTLDYIGVDDCAFKGMESAYILERGEVVESDHAAVLSRGKCVMEGEENTFTPK